MVVEIDTLGPTVVGCLFYGILLVGACARGWLIFSRSFRRDLPLAKAFHVLMILFALTRIGWIIESFLIEHVSQRVEFFVGLIVNRVAFLLFLTSYTLMLFNWIEIFHQSYMLKTTQALPRLLPIFVMFNLILYAYQIYVIVRLDADTQGEGDVWYDTNIVVLVGIFAVLSLGFLIYGLAMLRKIQRARRVTQTDSKSVGSRIITATGVFTLCFLARAAMFSYRLVTGQTLDFSVFFVFGYIVPEFFPPLYQIYLMRKVERSAATARAMAHLHALQEGEEYQQMTDPTEAQEGSSRSYRTIPSSYPPQS